MVVALPASGNVLSRKLNHLCCNGAIKKPYAMNLVKRSKSKGGGPRFDAGTMKSSSGHGTFLSSSLISMAKKSSLLSASGLSFFCRWRRRRQVRVWATVSAIPPST